MSALFDPWNDASLLATRLAKQTTLLMVLVGAEQWCAKCRNLRPDFELQANQSGNDEVWLWLDLEDHAEFIGDYLPEDLPMLIAYRGAHLLTCEVTGSEGKSIEQTITHLRSLRDYQPLGRDPGIRERLLLQDWAS